MIDIKDRICDVVAGKVMSAEAAAEFVKDGDNVGVSGFTPSGRCQGNPPISDCRPHGQGCQSRYWHRDKSGR